MSPEPSRGRIDWTLSATPARRNFRILIIAMLMPVGAFVGCVLVFLLIFIIAQGPRTPERSFTALDFLPPASVYPADYEVVHAPQWAGYYTAAGIGDEDDAYAAYKPESEAFGDVKLYVFHEQYWTSARDQYQDSLSWVDDYQPVSRLTFQSARAQEWTLLCQPRTTYDYEWQLCGYMARYDEFVIRVRGGVGPDHLSFAEFERLLQAIDQRAIELLGPTPAD